MSKDAGAEKVELSETETKVLMALYGDGQNSPALNPPQIATQTGLPLDTVRDALAFLEYVGFAEETKKKPMRS